MTLKKKTIFILVPFLVALASRTLLFILWHDSPFRFYHLVDGLDMKTFYSSAAKYFSANTGFDLYRIILAAIYRIDASYLPRGLRVLQVLLGSFSVLFSALLCRRIFKDNAAGLVAGCAAALFAPAILYDCLLLRESLFLFTCSLSLYAVQKIRGSSPGLKVILGTAAATLPFCVRISGLPWLLLASAWILFIRMKNQSIKSRLLPETAAVLFSPALLLLLISAFNASRGGAFSPFGKNIQYLSRYVITASAETRSVSLEQNNPSVSGGKTQVQNILTRMGRNTIEFFAPGEKPNNVNFHFISEFLPVPSFLIRSSVLIPAALTGWLLLALSMKKTRTRALLPGLYLLCFASVMIIFMPLSRYRIVMLPVLATGTAGTFVFIRNSLFKPDIRKKLAGLTAITLLVFAIFAWTKSSDASFRSEDYNSYGQMLEYSASSADKVENAYITACILAPESPSPLINLTRFLMARGRFDRARRLIEFSPAFRNRSFGLSLNYAVSLLGCGHPSKAETVLKTLKEPPEPDQKVKYFYQLAESFRMQKKYSEALEKYQKALQNTDNGKQIKIITGAMGKLKDE